MAVKTRVIQADRLDEAVALIKQGECVAFPTETVYGLGANALDEEAVSKIFAAKGRPADNPLIVHICSMDQIDDLTAGCHPLAKDLMRRFWPGPLSLVLPKSHQIPGIVSAGLDTVAIRMPDHPLALELIRRSELPIAAPSANISGSPSPTRAEHVLVDLDGRIPMIVDGGPTGWGVESTVLDCTCLPFRVLRPGGVTVEQLRQFAEIDIDPAVFHNGVTEKPRSPGLKYRHYAPKAEVVLVVGDRIPETINQLARSPEYAGRKIGVLAVSEHLDAYPGLTVLDLGPRHDPKTAAARLYSLLRAVDQLGLDVVFVEGFVEKEIGLAVMNRLRKAAGSRVIQS